MSAVLVDVTPEVVEEPAPTAVADDDGDATIMSPLGWQVVLGDDLSMQGRLCLVWTAMILLSENQPLCAW